METEIVETLAIHARCAPETELEFVQILYLLNLNLQLMILQKVFLVLTCSNHDLQGFVEEQIL